MTILVITSEIAAFVGLILYIVGLSMDRSRVCGIGFMFMFAGVTGLLLATMIHG